MPSFPLFGRNDQNPSTPRSPQANTPMTPTSHSHQSPETPSSSSKPRAWHRFKSVFKTGKNENFEVATAADQPPTPSSQLGPLPPPVSPRSTAVGSTTTSPQPSAESQPKQRHKPFSTLFSRKSKQNSLQSSPPAQQQSENQQSDNQQPPVSAAAATTTTSSEHQHQQSNPQQLDPYQHLSHVHHQDQTDGDESSTGAGGSGHSVVKAQATTVQKSAGMPSAADSFTPTEPCSTSDTATPYTRASSTGTTSGQSTSGGVQSGLSTNPRNNHHHLNVMGYDTLSLPLSTSTEPHFSHPTKQTQAGASAILSPFDDSARQNVLLDPDATSLFRYSVPATTVQNSRDYHTMDSSGTQSNIAFSPVSMTPSRFIAIGSAQTTIPERTTTPNSLLNGEMQAVSRTQQQHHHATLPNAVQYHHNDEIPTIETSLVEALPPVAALAAPAAVAASQPLNAGPSSSQNSDISITPLSSHHNQDDDEFKPLLTPSVTQPPPSQQQQHDHASNSTNQTGLSAFITPQVLRDTPVNTLSSPTSENSHNHNNDNLIENGNNDQNLAPLSSHPIAEHASIAFTASPFTSQDVPMDLNTLLASLPSLPFDDDAAVPPPTIASPTKQWYLPQPDGVQEFIKLEEFFAEFKKLIFRPGDLIVWGAPPMTIHQAVAAKYVDPHFRVSLSIAYGSLPTSVPWSGMMSHASIIVVGGPYDRAWILDDSIRGLKHQPLSEFVNTCGTRHMYVLRSKSYQSFTKSEMKLYLVIMRCMIRRYAPTITNSDYIDAPKQAKEAVTATLKSSELNPTGAAQDIQHAISSPKQKSLGNSFNMMRLAMVAYSLYGANPDNPVLAAMFAGVFHPSVVYFAAHLDASFSHNPNQPRFVCSQMCAQFMHDCQATLEAVFASFSNNNNNNWNAIFPNGQFRERTVSQSLFNLGFSQKTTFKGIAQHSKNPDFKSCHRAYHLSPQQIDLVRRAVMQLSAFSHHHVPKTVISQVSHVLKNTPMLLSAQTEVDKLGSPLLTLQRTTTATAASTTHHHHHRTQHLPIHAMITSSTHTNDTSAMFMTPNIVSQQPPPSTRQLQSAQVKMHHTEAIIPHQQNNMDKYHFGAGTIASAAVATSFGSGQSNETASVRSGDTAQPIVDLLQQPIGSDGSSSLGSLNTPLEMQSTNHKGGVSHFSTAPNHTMTSSHNTVGGSMLTQLTAAPSPFGAIRQSPILEQSAESFDSKSPLQQLSPPSFSRGVTPENTPHQQQRHSALLIPLAHSGVPNTPSGGSFSHETRHHDDIGDSYHHQHHHDMSTLQVRENRYGRTRPAVLQSNEPSSHHDSVSTHSTPYESSHTNELHHHNVVSKHSPHTINQSLTHLRRIQSTMDTEMSHSSTNSSPSQHISSLTSKLHSTPLLSHHSSHYISPQASFRPLHLPVSKSNETHTEDNSSLGLDFQPLHHIGPQVHDLNASGSGRVILPEAQSFAVDLVKTHSDLSSTSSISVTIQQQQQHHSKDQAEEENEDSTVSTSLETESSIDKDARIHHQEDMLGFDRTVTPTAPHVAPQITKGNLVLAQKSATQHQSVHFSITENQEPTTHQKSTPRRPSLLASGPRPSVTFSSTSSEFIHIGGNVSPDMIDFQQNEGFVSVDHLHSLVGQFLGQIVKKTIEVQSSTAGSTGMVDILSLAETTTFSQSIHHHHDVPDSDIVLVPNTFGTTSALERRHILPAMSEAATAHLLCNDIVPALPPQQLIDPSVDNSDEFASAVGSSIEHLDQPRDSIQLGRNTLNFPILAETSSSSSTTAGLSSSQLRHRQIFGSSSSRLDTDFSEGRATFTLASEITSRPQMFGDYSSSSTTRSITRLKSPSSVFAPQESPMSNSFMLRHSGNSGSLVDPLRHTANLEQLQIRPLGGESSPQVFRNISPVSEEQQCIALKLSIPEHRKRPSYNDEGGNLTASRSDVSLRRSLGGGVGQPSKFGPSQSYSSSEEQHVLADTFQPNVITQPLAITQIQQSTQLQKSSRIATQATKQPRNHHVTAVPGVLPTPLVIGTDLTEFSNQVQPKLVMPITVVGAQNAPAPTRSTPTLHPTQPDAPPPLDSTPLFGSTFAPTQMGSSPLDGAESPSQIAAPESILGDMAPLPPTNVLLGNTATPKRLHRHSLSQDQCAFPGGKPAEWMSNPLTVASAQHSAGTTPAPQLSPHILSPRDLHSSLPQAPSSSPHQLPLQPSLQPQSFEQLTLLSDTNKSLSLSIPSTTAASLRDDGPRSATVPSGVAGAGAVLPPMLPVNSYQTIVEFLTAMQPLLTGEMVIPSKPNETSTTATTNNGDSVPQTGPSPLDLSDPVQRQHLLTLCQNVSQVIQSYSNAADTTTEATTTPHDSDIQQLMDEFGKDAADAAAAASADGDGEGRGTAATDVMDPSERFSFVDDGDFPLSFLSPVDTTAPGKHYGMSEYHSSHQYNHQQHHHPRPTATAIANSVVSGGSADTGSFNFDVISYPSQNSAGFVPNNAQEQSSSTTNKTAANITSPRMPPAPPSIPASPNHPTSTFLHSSQHNLSSYYHFDQIPAQPYSQHPPMQQHPLGSHSSTLGLSPAGHLRYMTIEDMSRAPSGHTTTPLEKPLISPNKSKTSFDGKTNNTKEFIDFEAAISPSTTTSQSQQQQPYFHHQSHQQQMLAPSGRVGEVSNILSPNQEFLQEQEPAPQSPSDDQLRFSTASNLTRDSQLSSSSSSIQTSGSVQKVVPLPAALKPAGRSSNRLHRGSVVRSQRSHQRSGSPNSFDTCVDGVSNAGSGNLRQSIAVTAFAARESLILNGQIPTLRIDQDMTSPLERVMYQLVADTTWSQQCLLAAQRTGLTVVTDQQSVAGSQSSNTSSSKQSNPLVLSKPGQIQQQQSQQSQYHRQPTHLHTLQLSPRASTHRKTLTYAAHQTEFQSNTLSTSTTTKPLTVNFNRQFGAMHQQYHQQQQQQYQSGGLFGTDRLSTIHSPDAAAANATMRSLHSQGSNNSGSHGSSNNSSSNGNIQVVTPGTDLSSLHQINSTGGLPLVPNRAIMSSSNAYHTAKPLTTTTAFGRVPSTTMHSFAPQPTTTTSSRQFINNTMRPEQLQRITPLSNFHNNHSTHHFTPVTHNNNNNNHNINNNNNNTHIEATMYPNLSRIFSSTQSVISQSSVAPSLFPATSICSLTDVQSVQLMVQLIHSNSPGSPRHMKSRKSSNDLHLQAAAAQQQLSQQLPQQQQQEEQLQNQDQTRGPMIMGVLTQILTVCEQTITQFGRVFEFNTPAILENHMELAANETIIHLRNEICAVTPGLKDDLTASETLELFSMEKTSLSPEDQPYADNPDELLYRTAINPVIDAQPPKHDPNHPAPRYCKARFQHLMQHYFEAITLAERQSLLNRPDITLWTKTDFDEHFSNLWGFITPIDLGLHLASHELFYTTNNAVRKYKRASDEDR